MLSWDCDGLVVPSIVLLPCHHAPLPNVDHGITANEILIVRAGLMLCDRPARPGAETGPKAKTLAFVPNSQTILDLFGYVRKSVLMVSRSFESNTCRVYLRQVLHSQIRGRHNETSVKRLRPAMCCYPQFCHRYPNAIPPRA